MGFNFKMGDVVALPALDQEGEPCVEKFKTLRREFGPKGVTIWRFIDVEDQYENDLGLTDHEIEMNLNRIADYDAGRLH